MNESWWRSGQLVSYVFDPWKLEQPLEPRRMTNLFWFQEIEANPDTFSPSSFLYISIFLVKFFKRNIYLKLGEIFLKKKELITLIDMRSTN